MSIVFFIAVFIEEVKCSADQITGLHLNLLNKVLNSLFTMLVFLSRFRGGFSSAISLTSHGSGSAFSTKASSRLLIIHSVNFSSSAGLNFLFFNHPLFVVLNHIRKGYLSIFLELNDLRYCLQSECGRPFV